MDSDDKNNGEFMAISHTAIVIEKIKMVIM